jgi:predicted  nucleic acid-binding Zn-ribbon protein
VDVASDRLPDLDELALELVQLEHREPELERRLIKLQDRYATCPSELTERQIAALQHEHLEMRRRMNTIRAKLLPIMRVRDE